MVEEFQHVDGFPFTRRYVHGPGMDEPLVWYEGSGASDRRWLVADERGSIVGAFGAGGVEHGYRSYDEYGKPQDNWGNAGRFGYTGQAWLPQIGLYYYKARMYDPSLPRFMQTDPSGYGDGMNLYPYAGGDPVNFTDPWGLSRIKRTTPGIARKHDGEGHSGGGGSGGGGGNNGGGAGAPVDHGTIYVTGRRPPPPPPPMLKPSDEISGIQYLIPPQFRGQQFRGHRQFRGHNI